MEFSSRPLRILARIVEPGDMRYDTIGDWTYDIYEDVLTVTMVKLDNPHYQKALFTHELHEAQLCLSSGVSPEEIDRFDQDYEHARSFGGQIAPCGCSFTEGSEPGDDIHAPYYGAHQDASIVERLFIAHLRENWGHYDDACQRALDAVRMARKEVHDERQRTAARDPRHEEAQEDVNHEAQENEGAPGS